MPLTFDPGPIADARSAKGWSRVRLAQESGVSRGTVANIERGAFKPRIDQLAALMSTLDIEPAAVFVHAPEVAKTSKGATKKITRGDQAGKPSPAGNATGA